MRELIDKIAGMEWEMFQHVNNMGGRASCQDDRVSFDIMRKSQFEAWEEPLLRSYLDDVEQAFENKENLVAEKYAYMMESTHPAEFERVKERIKPIDPESKVIIGELLEIFRGWNALLNKKYPYVLSRGRPLESTGDSAYATSVETYLKGELSTYSQRTLKLYLNYAKRMIREGKNIAEEILRNTARSYGYRNLDQAENALAGRNQEKEDV